MMGLQPDSELAVLEALLPTMPNDVEHLLPMLHAIQQQLGFISPGAMRVVAEAFNVSRAEVYGVVSFYGDFRETPVGRTVIQLCMAEACQSVGCRGLAAHAERSLGVPLGQSTSDGCFHLEAVYCLGNCALGPAMRVGDEVVGRVTPDRFDAVVAARR